MRSWRLPELIHSAHICGQYTVPSAISPSKSSSKFENFLSRQRWAKVRSTRLEVHAATLFNEIVKLTRFPNRYIYLPVLNICHFSCIAGCGEISFQITFVNIQYDPISRLHDCQGTSRRQYGSKDVLYEFRWEEGSSIDIQEAFRDFELLPGHAPIPVLCQDQSQNVAKGVVAGPVCQCHCSTIPSPLQRCDN